MSNSSPITLVAGQLAVCTTLALVATGASAAAAAKSEFADSSSKPNLMSIGDSLTQGVQSNDASWQTQLAGSYPCVRG